MAREMLLRTGLRTLRLGLQCQHRARCPRGQLRSSQGGYQQSRIATRGAATFTTPRQAQQISVLQTTVDKQSAAYQENDLATKELIRKFEELHSVAALGGSQKARDKHVSAGKMLARE